MNRAQFVEDSQLVEFCLVGKYLFFPKTMELMDTENDTVRTFDSFDDLFADADFSQGVSALESVLIDPDGGRGSSSSSSSRYRFTNARSSGSEQSVAHFPSEFNTGEKLQSFDIALDRFSSRHANSDVEYAIAVDEQGFVHQYIQGGATSVAIAGRNGQMIIHNHPSGGNFSKADMLSTAQVSGERGIVASGKNGDYIFTKGKNFNSAGFAKAVNSARPYGKSYDDAIGKWLTKNQTKYGYTYEFRKR